MSYMTLSMCAMTRLHSEQPTSYHTAHAHRMLTQTGHTHPSPKLFTPRTCTASSLVVVRNSMARRV